jgi:hypothetical protein
VRPASCIASSIACAARAVVRVSDISVRLSVDFKAAVDILISPVGKISAYFESRLEVKPIPQIPFLRAAWFSEAELPKALITPMPVIKTLAKKF